MRHRYGLRKLNVTGSHRKAKLTALCNALIEHETIRTTLPKAKELSRVIEPLITLSRTPTVHNRRQVFSRLRNRANVVKLFDDIGPRNQDRPGGYVRVLKNGFRTGDAAPMAFVEFVARKREDDIVEEKTKTKATKATKADKKVVAAETAKAKTPKTDSSTAEKS